MELSKVVERMAELVRSRAEVSSMAEKGCLSGRGVKGWLEQLLWAGWVKWRTESDHEKKIKKKKMSPLRPWGRTKTEPKQVSRIKRKNESTRREIFRCNRHAMSYM